MTSTLDELRKVRIQKLEEIKKLGINPYPAKSLRKQTCAVALEMMGKQVAVAGRIMAIRGHGGIQFFDLRDESGKIQIVFKSDKLNAENSKLLTLLDIGDFIDVQGEVFKTQAGEISVLASDFHLLTKAIRPLPSTWYGLKDVEERFRKRYLDLILSPEVKNRFIMRFKIIRAIQQFLDEQGYIELETPVLQNLYGGTNAKPFTTHLNALDQNMYLRVADELYLKRLVVGGFDKVYEIAKDFRNEGLDLSHNPEFTMIEFYEAYADYHRIMELTEGLYKSIAIKLFGKEQVTVLGKPIDLSGQWPKIKMVDILKQELNLDVEKSGLDDLLKFARDQKLEINGKENKGELIYIIFDHLIPEHLIQPTWIIDYPAAVSPLSKAHPDNPDFVQRFEGYIGGKEICDGWSELNDPQVQRERFEGEQKAEKEGHHKDAHPVDEDFLEAMEYGMPPLGGIGIGIDRLTMFFTDTWSIKEVILFPLMRPESIAEVDVTKVGDVVKVKVEEPKQKGNTSKGSDKLNITHEQALKFLNENVENKNIIKHMMATEAMMRALARKLKNENSELKTEKINEDEWAMAGLLHDGDYNPGVPVEQQGIRVTEMLREKGFEIPDNVAHAMAAHNWHNTGVEPSSLMDWSLFCGDSLTGLIVAGCLVLPSKKLADLTVESVLKRYKEPSFAKGTRRDEIAMCDEKLGISLVGFVEIVLEAMQDISQDLGL